MRFTEEELRIAKSVDLCAVASHLGYIVRRIGKYHTLKEMDSIRIYNRTHWFRWSRRYEKGENGGSQIDFLRVFAGMDVKEAVFWLLDFTGYKLKTIGVVSEPDGQGNYPVVMDQESFEKRINRYQELSNRMRQIAAAKNTALTDITITKQLIAAENDHAVKTRVPGMYGSNVGYIWIRKEDIMEIHNGKTLLTYLDKEKDYKIYSEDNRVLYTMKGEDLYAKHYDRVERTVRERYQKVKQSPDKNVVRIHSEVRRR